MLLISISILLTSPVSSDVTKKDIERMVHLITTITSMNNDSLAYIRTINDALKAFKTVPEVSDDMWILIHKYSRLLDEIFPSILSSLSEWAWIETTTTEGTKVENATLREDIPLETPKDGTPKDETPKDETPKDETPKDMTPEEKELVQRGKQSNAPNGDQHVDDAVIETATSAMDTFFNWLSSHVDGTTDNI